MKTTHLKTFIRWSQLGCALWLLTPLAARAHCDTLEGPVVVAARQALAAGDITPVLKWIKAPDEKTIRSAFDRAIAVRRESPAAAELADLYFFETLVRVHRAGEGAPYTGLKSATDIDPGVDAADRALASGKVKALATELSTQLQHQIETKFARVSELQQHAEHNVDAGRAFVAAYVDYVHFVEAVSAFATQSSSSAAAHQH